MDVISYFGMILLALPGVGEVPQRCQISNFPWCQVELSTSSLLVMFQAAITLGMILSPLVTARQVTMICGLGGFNSLGDLGGGCLGGLGDCQLLL